VRLGDIIEDYKTIFFFQIPKEKVLFCESYELLTILSQI
jgi:hypothetical protein